MAELIPNVLVYGIIAIVVLVIILGGGGYIYANVIKPNLDQLEFEKLPYESQKEVADNWDNLTKNINSCYNLEDFDCTCDGFINFPSTFRKDYFLKIEENKLSLYFKSSRLKETSIRLGGERYFKSAPSSDKKIESNNEIGNILFELFGVEGIRYPKFNNNVVLSGKFYKPSPRIVTFITSEIDYIVYEGMDEAIPVLYTVGDINKRPQCINWRSSAKIRFNEFITCLNTKLQNENCPFSVKDEKGSILAGFRVFIGGSGMATASLFYNKDSVKDYDLTQKKQITVNDAVPVICDSTTLEVANGDYVKITQKNGNKCLQKSSVSA